MSRQKSRGCRLRHLDKSWCGLFFVQWLPEPSLGLWRWSNADGYRTLWPGAAMILSKPGICRPETGDNVQGYGKHPPRTDFLRSPARSEWECYSWRGNSGSESFDLRRLDIGPFLARAKSYKLSSIRIGFPKRGQAGYDYGTDRRK